MAFLWRAGGVPSLRELWFSRSLTSKVPEVISQASSLAIVSLTRPGPFLLTSPPLAFHLSTLQSGVCPSPSSYTNRNHTQASSQEMMGFRYRLSFLSAGLSSSQMLSSPSLPFLSCFNEMRQLQPLWDPA